MSEEVEEEVSDGGDGGVGGKDDGNTISFGVTTFHGSQRRERGEGFDVVMNGWPNTSVVAMSRILKSGPGDV